MGVRCLLFIKKALDFGVILRYLVCPFVRLAQFIKEIKVAALFFTCPNGIYTMDHSIGYRISVKECRFWIRPIFRQKNLTLPCRFLVGPTAMASCVRAIIVLDGKSSSCTLQYVPRTTRQCFL
jgi:hypothetical protein